MQYPAELHEKTIDWFTRLLLRPRERDEDVEGWDTEMDRAVRHVAGCQQCLVELDATVRVLSQGTDSILPSCPECAGVLGEVAGLDEAQARDRYPRVWLHIQLCDDCRAAVDRLRSMMARERAGVYGPVPGAPVFGAIPMSIPSEAWKKAEKPEYRLAYEVALVQQEDGVSLQPVQEGQVIPTWQLLPGFRLEATTVPVRRKGAGEKPDRIWSLTLPTDGGPEIRLTAYPTDRGSLELEVSVRSEQPVVGARVTLTDEQGLTPWAEETDEEGTAFLAEVSLKRYTLEVAHAGSAWLIPLNLSPA